MMPYKALIIDDEQPARELVKSYLQGFANIQIAGECQNGFEGLKAIQEISPDLIFLDIQMPKITGFEMLELLDKMPVVIFSTAYDQFAIRAFELNAADYLLKPYSIDRFALAVERAVHRIESSMDNSGEVKKIIETHRSETGILDRIVVKTGSRIKLIPVDQVEYLEAYDDYVNIYTPEGRFIKQQTMGFYEKHLSPAEFARVHRSYIVKVSQIAQIENYEKDSKILLMRSGARIRASRAGMGRLREMLGI